MTVGVGPSGMGLQKMGRLVEINLSLYLERFSVQGSKEVEQSPEGHLGRYVYKYNLCEEAQVSFLPCIYLSNNF